MIVLHGFNSEGSLVIWVVGDGPSVGGRYVIEFCVRGKGVMKQEVRMNSEFVHNANLHIGTLAINNIFERLNGNTTDLSMLLYKDNEKIGPSVPFVTPTSF